MFTGYRQGTIQSTKNSRDYDSGIDPPQLRNVLQQLNNASE